MINGHEHKNKFLAQYGEQIDDESVEHYFAYQVMKKKNIPNNKFK
jgi:hypothetical protein